MSSKNTWLWMTVAVVLFAFIFLFERYRPHPQTGPTFLLPELNPKAVLMVEIRPAGHQGIRAEHTNGGWRLVEPVLYSAQSTNIQNLLDALQRLTVVHQISEQELRKDPKADEDYGIDPPETLLVLCERESTNRIHIGHRTSPGDQVFMQVIGMEGISIVDADVLNFLPQNADAWRDATLTDFAHMNFNHITVTNTVKNQSFLLQRDSTNKLWAMTFPLKTRADSDKVEDALQKIESLRVRQFISDDPKADLDAFGLQPPALTFVMGDETNALLAIDFGKRLTNSPGLVYAHRRDQNAIVAVSTNVLGQWDASYDVFRDRHLATLTGPIEAIEIHGRDIFSLVWQTNNSWRVLPQDFPADQTLAAGLARKLGELQVVDFVKDSVTEPDLPHYGLAPAPAREYILKWTSSPTATNPPTELDFGTNSSNQVFARRIGEDAVYGISPVDFESLPSASWEMRERRVWNFDVNDVAQITIQQNGQTRQIVHKSTNGWSLATGFSGIINDSAIEDTARELGHLTAFAWVGHGAAKLNDFGFAPGGYHLSIELRSGEKLEVQLGANSRLGSPYGSVVLNGEPWIFEFPPDLYASLQFCLAIPPHP
ncbi:MAG TPA: DUF4340 domain-containing protein [Verrucomicrobiae bacterium]|jgi:hypothetical protein|nr:DUF4340 domain-containing protein [Verrucomicrobiae bacterium]